MKFELDNILLSFIRKFLCLATSNHSFLKTKRASRLLSNCKFVIVYGLVFEVLRPDYNVTTCCYDIK